MADFQLNSALTQTAWSKNYFKSYVRKSGFAQDMKKANAPIIVNTDLSKVAGDLVRIPYFGNLTGAGVTGSTALVGNEEALGNYPMEVRVQQKRHAVVVHENDQYKTDLELANIASMSLNDWHANDMRTDIITALGSIPVTVASSPDTTVTYASANSTQKNAWNAANSDRLVFGSSTATASGDNAADLATIAAGEVLTASILLRARDLALATSTYKINPYGVEETMGREFFIFYTGMQGYNQLRNDTDVKNAMLYAYNRGENTNPLIRGGDIEFDGIIIRRIPEIGLVGNVGTSSASVAASYLCGCNAVGVAWSSMPEARRKNEDDYGEQTGIAIRDVRGTKKLTASLKDVGQVTVFHAAV